MPITALEKYKHLCLPKERSISSSLSFPEIIAKIVGDLIQYQPYRHEILILGYLWGDQDRLAN